MFQTVLRSLGGLVIGAAVWFTLGTLAITDQQVAAGLLPPWSLLALFSLAGAVVGAWLQTIPLSIVLLPATLVLPWIASPRFWPVFIWTGPFVLVAWALFFVAAAEARKWQLARIDSRWWVAIAVSAPIAAFACGAWRSPVIGGDEPHYLLIAQSILLDHDVNLINDYDVARHGDFYPGVLAHHTVPTADGKEYSFHGIGTGVLALPGFWIAGLIGVRISFLLACIAGVVVFWIAARELTDEPHAAWPATGSLVLQLPFLAQTAAIYPDGSGAAITSFALLTLVRLERQTAVSVTWLCACATLLSTLPWLHLRFAAVAAIFAIAISFALWRRGRSNDVLVFLAIPLIAATLFFASSYVMFRTLDPTAPFRVAASGSFAAIPKGVFGLLFDHEYGLLPYAPVVVFALAGWRALHARAPLVSIASAAIVVATVITGAAFVWWGGASSPARFLVPVLPAIALPVGAWWTTAGRHDRTRVAAMTTVGAVIAALAAWAENGRYITNNPDGRLTIFEWANSIVDLAHTMPSLFRPGATLASEATVALVWIVSAAVTLRLARKWPAAWAVVACLTIGMVGGALVRRDDPLAPARSQQALLHAAVSPWLSTAWLGGGPAASVDRVLRTLAVEMPLMPAPAGRYRVEVSNVDVNADPGTMLSLIAGRGEHAIATWPLSMPNAAPHITLPVAVESLRVVASSSIGGTRVRLRSLARVPIERAGDALATYAVRSQDALLFVFDVPQGAAGGFWVASDRPVAVLCTRLDGEAPCAGLQFDAESHDARLRVSQGQWVQTISIPAGQRARVDIPQTFDLVLLEATGPPSRTRALFVSAGPAPAAR